LEGCRDGKGMGGVREFFCFIFESWVYSYGVEDAEM
jgi:hypothetical protein